MNEASTNVAGSGTPLGALKVALLLLLLAAIPLVLWQQQKQQQQQQQRQALASLRAEIRNEMAKGLEDIGGSRLPGFKQIQHWRAALARFHEYEALRAELGTRSDLPLGAYSLTELVDRYDKLQEGIDRNGSVLGEKETEDLFHMCLLANLVAESLEMRTPYPDLDQE